MNFLFWIGISLAGICSCFAAYPPRNATRSWAIQRELKTILKDLWSHLETKEDVDEMLYEDFKRRLETIQNNQDYHNVITNVRSFRYDWHRINFLLTTMRIRIVDRNTESTSPVQIPSANSISILRKLMLDIHHLCELADTRERKAAKSGALVIIDTYQFVMKALDLDDRVRTVQEDVLIGIIKAELLALSGKFINDPSMQQIFQPLESEPSENLLNNGKELLHEGLDIFTNSLTPTERDIIEKIEGVNVVKVESKKCAVYSKVGKWWLHTYTCDI